MSFPWLLDLPPSSRAPAESSKDSYRQRGAPVSSKAAEASENSLRPEIVPSTSWIESHVKVFAIEKFENIKF